MMTNERSDYRMLRLAVEGADVDYLNVAAALIRELPRVLRGRVDLDARQLEILHEHPVAGLIQKIHFALLTAGSELVALRA